ncbi:hypothetical protein ACG7TL_004905 [Trametes sanguinea]
MYRRILREVGSALIINAQRGGVSLRETEGVEDAAEPEALFGRFGSSDIFGFGRGVCGRRLFASAPGDHPRTQGEAVSANGASGVRTAAVVRIGVAEEKCRTRAAEIEAEVARAFEVANDTFSGFPVSVTVAVEELRELLDGEGDIGARADGHIVQTADKRTIRPGGGSRFSGHGRGGIEGGSNRMGVGESELEDDTVNEGGLGKADRASSAVTVDPRTAEVSLEAVAGSGGACDGEKIVDVHPESFVQFPDPVFTTRFFKSLWLLHVADFIVGQETVEKRGLDVDLQNIPVERSGKMKEETE